MHFLYTATFQKQYKKLSKRVWEQVDEKLGILLENEFHPLLNNHKLHGKYKDYRSINISGDIRLVYKKLTKETVYLIEIGTHSKLYE